MASMHPLLNYLPSAKIPKFDWKFISNFKIMVDDAMERRISVYIEAKDEQMVAQTNLPSMWAKLAVDPVK